MDVGMGRIRLRARPSLAATQLKTSDRSMVRVTIGQSLVIRIRFRKVEIIA